MAMINRSWFPRRPHGGYRFAAAFVLTLSMIAAGVSGPAGSSVSAQAPNPCSLLSTEEIQPLAPAEVSIPAGVSSSLQAMGSATCRYMWGAGTERTRLEVIVSDASRMFPGTSPDQIKSRLQSVRAGTPDAVVSELGEAAVFKSDSPYYANATAFLKGRILEVHLDGRTARESKDQVIGLLKSAASKL